jgi:hypothetical protein
MAYIPNQAVFWRIEDVMQGNGELDSAKVRTEMAARFRDCVNQTLAQFMGQSRQAFT